MGWKGDKYLLFCQIIFLMAWKPWLLFYSIFISINIFQNINNGFAVDKRTKIEEVKEGRCTLYACIYIIQVIIGRYLFIQHPPPSPPLHPTQTNLLTIVIQWNWTIENNVTNWFSMPIVSNKNFCSQAKLPKKESFEEQWAQRAYYYNGRARTDQVICEEHYNDNDKESFSEQFQSNKISIFHRRSGESIISWLNYPWPM